MAKRYKNQKHLAFIRTLPCLIQKGGFYTHSNIIEAHHLLKPASGFRGWGLKSHDSECIPLCNKHHSELHTKFGNEFKFFEHYGLPATFGQEWAKIYFETGCDFVLNADVDDDLPF